MNKYSSIVLAGILFPLSIMGADKLEDITVVDNIEQEDIKADYKEESFYKGYARELITKEDIEEESSNSLADAIKSVASVIVKDKGSFSKSISIRGFSGERVASIVDGAKMSNQGMTMGGGGELGLVDSSSVESIEVIKGSPSVVYDPGATGGVVRVSTIKNIKKMKDKVSLKYNYGYDEGYELNKHNLNFLTKYKDFYFAVGKSTVDSNNRKMKDKDKLVEALHETNIRDERYGTPYELTDLGYESEAEYYFASYGITDNIDIYYKNYSAENDDITATYGSRIPIAFHYDEYNREGEILGLNIKDVYGFNKIDITNHKQELYRLSYGESNSKNEFNLKIDTKKIDIEYPIGDVLLLSGIEETKDEAKTYTWSEQTYQALYLNAEYMKSDFTFNAGARYNNYNVKQHIQPNQNLDTVYELIGNSGVLKGELNDDKINYSTGVTYAVNEYNNIAFNYSKTYRYPSLYERFAFGGAFVGGGADMEAEVGDNYELSWKHLEDDLSYNIAIFQTDFETYNDTYSQFKIKNMNALDACNENPNCDPFDDHYNEERIFSVTNKYASFDNVKSQGFEIGVAKEFPKQNIKSTFQLSQTKIDDSVLKFKESNATLETGFLHEPLELSATVKKSFNHDLKPWIKFRLRHVTNSPTVNQKGGFDSFSTGNLYFGMKYKNFTFNAGVRNITDEVYNEPYSPLDGVERTFFFNTSMTLEKLL